ncbi:hypothetical protein [Aestuariispira insulae]|uniref:Lipoprotein n=1 Tax=Aestuariispira insulae TaxID=1461337 RepID=A0A3D9HX12_9PROT|nr:hypothetical protein [Aestuariispira insulae]RED54038.1 hypothetical protein DFP90_101839 [Aestuariispira insulae]
MKKRVLQLTMLFGTLAALSACVSDSDLGVRNRALTEAESPLVFDYPGIEGGYRKFLAGRSVDYRQKYLQANYGPKSGAFPSLVLLFWKLTDVEYYYPKRSIDEQMTVFFDTPPNHSEPAFVVYTEGRADYVTFEDNGGHCMFFVVKWGGHLSSRGGNRELNGLFCDQSQIDSAKAEKVIKSVQVLNEGEVIKVANSEKPKKASGSAGQTSTMTGFKADRVEIIWNGVFDKQKLDINSRMYTSYDGVISFEDPKTGTCKGDFILDKALDQMKRGDLAKGSWNIECSAGQAAEGRLKLYQGDEGKVRVSGEGEDRQKNAISFTM